MSAWNPNDATGVAFSNSNLTVAPAVASGTWCGARGVKGVDSTSGLKLYFEVTADSNINDAGTNQIRVGAADASVNFIAPSLPGWDVGIGQNVISVSVDLTATATYPANIYYPMIASSLGSAAINGFTINTAGPFTNTVPAGYVAWDTAADPTFTALRNTATLAEVLIGGSASGGEARVSSTFAEVLRSVATGIAPLDLSATFTDDSPPEELQATLWITTGLLQAAITDDEGFFVSLITTPKLLPVQVVTIIE